MKAVCIEKSEGITIGKIYNIEKIWTGDYSGSLYYDIINDDNAYCGYHAFKFQTACYVVDLL